jgi:AGCS family alanine or glycine:cation symporter
VALSVFAFTTILGWSYYGERCAAFMFSEKAIMPYRFIYIAVVFFSAAAIALEDQIGNIVNLFWLMADTLTGLMAAPNLLALLLLSPIVFKLTRDYFDKEKEANDGLVDQDDLPRGS